MCQVGSPPIRAVQVWKDLLKQKLLVHGTSSVWNDNNGTPGVPVLERVLMVVECDPTWDRVALAWGSAEPL
jgi:hypothetical protein